MYGLYLSKNGGMIMLKASETNNKPVKTKCYGEIQVWDNREEAVDFFLEAMMNSEGSEHERYSAIYIQLMNGLDFCSDES